MPRGVYDRKKVKKVRKVRKRETTKQLLDRFYRAEAELALLYRQIRQRFKNPPR